MKHLSRLVLFSFSFLFATFSFREALAAPSPDPELDPFTVAWMTDTQCLVYYDDMRNRFFSQVDWIEREPEIRNIRLLIHTGDIMDNSFVPWQLEHAENAFARIDSSLPILPIAGNHDISMKRQSYENWGSFQFVQRVPPEQRYMDGHGVYDLIEVVVKSFCLSVSVIIILQRKPYAGQRTYLTVTRMRPAYSLHTVILIRAAARCRTENTLTSISCRNVITCALSCADTAAALHTLFVTTSARTVRYGPLIS